jgi:hypothetical protein
MRDAARDLASARAVARFLGVQKFDKNPPGQIACCGPAIPLVYCEQVHVECGAIDRQLVSNHRQVTETRKSPPLKAISFNCGS